MTTYTRAQLITHAYQKSGLYGADESVTADDSDFATKVIASRAAALAIRGIPIIDGSDEDVPEAWFDPLGDYMGMFLLSANGGPFPTADQIEGAERILRELRFGRPDQSVAEAEYF